MVDVLAIPRIDIYQRLFQLRNYSFITDIGGVTHTKQLEALNALTNNTHKEIAYGGAAGGAKSWTGATWLLFMCLLYPQTRWFIGREELKSLRKSTLITFFKVCAFYKFTDYHYNGQDYVITFKNGSVIELLEMKELPSDPLFERYGSVEFTGGWVEEAGEICQMAYDTLKSRIGRHFNDKYGLLPKIFITFNPKKNFLYQYFYIPSKEGTLPPHITFIKALLYDNPFRESSYEGQLLSMSNVGQKERLLHGNFDYDDDPTALCDYDAICDVFTNEHVPTGVMAISADLAMQGRDMFVAGLWSGMRCKVAISQAKSTGKSIETDLYNLSMQHAVGRSKIIADSDGLGNYLGSYLTGIKEFHGGATAHDKKEFANLKAECAYKLAEKINKREIYVYCTDLQRKQIIEELGQLKADSVDKDESRKRIVSKDRMKAAIGRSPDYLDMLIMGMYFEVIPQFNTFVSRG